MTGFFEVERQRHGKTTCFGRADEFLRVCATRVFESRREGVGTFKCAAPQFHLSLAVLQRAFPNSGTNSCCHNRINCGRKMRNAKAVEIHRWKLERRNLLGLCTQLKPTNPNASS